MSSAYKIQVMLIIELFDYILPECVRYTSLIFSPRRHIFVGITPEQVAEKSIIGDVTWPIQILNLLETVKLRRKAPMHTENPLLNYG